ncbi:MAG TPA: DNA alkylation repair protein, partial [Arthrobacter sp.]|nr:DNA alkylation repair protein [Arthrobacter sp.]
DPDVWLRRAALIAPLRALKSGGGDWDGFARRARIATGLSPAQDNSPDGSPDREAMTTVLDAVAERRPELRLTFRGSGA